MIAALVAALVGGFVGIFLAYALVRVLRQHHRRKFAGLDFIQASNQSTVPWKNASSPSITSPTSGQPRRKISEPILLKNFEGDGITLSPHMSEMLGVHSKRACRGLSQLSFSPRNSFRGIPSEPEAGEPSGFPSQNNAGVPMLLRRPRRKSVSALQGGSDSVYSAVSAESMYSEASAPSHVHQTLSSSAANIEPEVLATPLASDESIELVSIRKTENRGSQSWTLDPSATTRVSAFVGAFNQVRRLELLRCFSDFSQANTPIIENLYFSPPGLPLQHTASIEPPRTASVDRRTSLPPDVPARSPLRSRSVRHIL